MVYKILSLLYNTYSGGDIIAGPEKLYENRFRKWLESKGVYNIGTPKQKKKAPQIGIYMKNFGCMFTCNGTPDYLIDIRGRSIWLEFKAANGRPSTVQIKIVDNINSWGGTAKIIYPKDFDDARRLIERVIYETKDS